MAEHSWVQEFCGAVTVCDADGMIVEMNYQAARAFAKQGGGDLIGTNVLDCHPEPARSKLKRLMETQQRNAYTSERNGVKKLVYQAPWYEDGRYCGFVELMLEIPAQMPHFVREG